MQITDHDLKGYVAYSYARFSDPSQSAGQSLERQQNYAPEFCKEFGCKLDSSLTFKDEGKSAFHGKHISEGGGLARFVQFIEAGRVRSGEILIIENLDRMSRLPLEQAEELLRSILTRGVRIHTRSPWAIYDRATLNDAMQRMQMIFEFTRSHRESKYKQERLSRRWISNRDRIRKGEYHLANVPAWLTPKRESGKVVGYDVDPAASATVKRIYQLCCDGVGMSTICKMLNQENVPTLGGGKNWGRSYIFKILKNRAVLGEYQPFSSVKVNGREIESSRRVAVNEPIKDHFPRIISDKVFEQAQLSLNKRTVARTGAGTESVVNLFAGLLRDVRSGSTMHVNDKGYGAQLVSTDAVNGVGEAVYIPYAMLERAFVMFADQMPLDMVFAKDEGKLEQEIQDMRKRLESMKLQIVKIKAKVNDNLSDALLELLVEKDVEGKRLAAELEQLERQRNSSAAVAAASTKKILQAMPKATGDKLNAIRTKLRNELKYWIKTISILPMRLGKVKSAMVCVQLTNGERIDFRCSDDLVEWPKELDDRDVLKFAKWPKAIQKTHWDAVSMLDKKLMELDDKGMSLQEIADETEIGINSVSRRLKKLGRSRQSRRTLDENRSMTWVARANGWQRYRNGKRYYVGCGTLKKLFPKLVTSSDEEGTLAAANKWWKQFGA